jgi:signal transduction histidine kinase
VTEGAIAPSLLFGLLWFAVLALAVWPAGRRKAALASPAVLVIVGNGLALLAPAIADLTGGDPGRSRLVLAAGTALCALIMSTEGLHQVLRGQRERLLASEVDRVLADQVHQAERAARSELDHDVAAALTAVEGAARALERRGAEAGGRDHGALAAAMASEVARLQLLIRRVSDGSGSGTFDLGAAVLPVITCDLALGHDIRAEVPAQLLARGSARATAQVLRNLLDNSYRYAPGSEVRITANREGDRLVLRVQDDGPGVADGDRERIFERGERASTAGPDGSGLGLFVASRLMEDQGGELVLEDAPGTTFSMRLPAATVSPNDG